MNTVLLILGILGIGAILIAAYVFTVAARNYVSDANVDELRDGNQDSPKRLYVVRSNQDRRQHTGVADFPLQLVSGELVEFDRRRDDDRRSARA